MQNAHEGMGMVKRNVEQPNVELEINERTMAHRRQRATREQKRTPDDATAAAAAASCVTIPVPCWMGDDRQRDELGHAKGHEKTSRYEPMSTFKRPLWLHDSEMRVSIDHAWRQARRKEVGETRGRIETGTQVICGKGSTLA